MAVRTTSWLSWFSRLSASGLTATLLDQLRLTLRLLREPAVPVAFKALPIAAGLYLLSPLDVIPDVLPLLGQLDDVGLLLVAVQSFLRLCPADAVRHHRAALAERRPFTPLRPVDRVIDAQFRRHDGVR